MIDLERGWPGPPHRQFKGVWICARLWLTEDLTPTEKFLIAVIDSLSGNRPTSMGKIVAYLRATTDKQDLNHQKLELLEFARKRGIKINEFVEVTISSRKTSKQRRIDEGHCRPLRALSVTVSP